ncbi:hypothetical protein BLA17378_00605 [Burkholderia aenigmatica]|uniref:Uncharacterized protein n=3 Tax=Burkholderia TaxID=32008 RepID=A0ABY6XJC7_9BURK|nr:darcynin family protein [Burkholderia aenigmatica]VWC49374.1 hypothetical protein BLA17378_00605 [Burkholderia aenigmatica]VWD14791.1 hypothetical protein BLA18628_03457 [Burkholderia aenigmatica]
MPRLTAPPPTLFILVKTRPEWPGRPAPQRLRLRRDPIAPLRTTHGANAPPRFDDAGFHSARVTGVRVRRAQDHHTCERVIEARREIPFRDRDFNIVTILSGVEHVNASGDGKIVLSAVQTHTARRRHASAASAQSFFPCRPLKKTTVATCGTTVVVRDSTVTLWA